MANILKAYTPGNVIQGPADIYVDVQAPPSAVPPVQGTNSWAASGTYLIDANGQPTDNGAAGFHAGLAEGPAVFTKTPKFDEIRADQHGAPVDAAFISAETEIDFVVKEAILTNLQKFFTSLLGTFTAVVAGANPAADFLQFGSPQTAQAVLRTLLLISPDRSAAGKYFVLQAYKAALKSAIPTVFGRGTQNMWKLKFYCIADTTRVLEDYVAQIVRTV